MRTCSSRRAQPTCSRRRAVRCDEHQAPRPFFDNRIGAECVIGRATWCNAMQRHATWCNRFAHRAKRTQFDEWCRLRDDPRGMRRAPGERSGEKDQPAPIRPQVPSPRSSLPDPLSSPLIPARCEEWERRETRGTRRSRRCLSDSEDPDPSIERHRGEWDVHECASFREMYKTKPICNSCS